MIDNHPENSTNRRLTIRVPSERIDPGIGATGECHGRALRRRPIVADAPLSRTPKTAADGTLDTMVGADDATFAIIDPVRQAWAGTIARTGAAVRNAHAAADAAEIMFLCQPIS